MDCIRSALNRFGTKPVDGSARRVRSHRREGACADVPRGRAQRKENEVGQNGSPWSEFVIENRTGISGNIAIEEVVVSAGVNYAGGILRRGHNPVLWRQKPGTDRIENQHVGHVDDIVHRRGLGEHRHRAAADLVAGGQVRQVKVGEHIGRALLGADAEVLDHAGTRSAGADFGPVQLQSRVSG